MKRWLKRILYAHLIVILLAAALFGYSYFIEPRRLVLNHTQLNVPNFSPKLNGLKIVAIADIHGGSNHVTEEKLRDIVSKTNEQNPDLIVLLGDYISQVKGKRGALMMPVETIADNLQGLKAKYGVYAVIGNHDWWYNENKVRTEFERVGIKILDNEAVEIKIGDETLWFWGIEDLWKHHKVPTAVFEKIQNKQNIIALTHNPDSLFDCPKQISLLFAGHSHGGQVNFPIYGTKAFVNDPRFMHGHAEVDGKHVFVTSGIGTSILPFRFRVPPEIAVVTLISAD